MKRCVYVPLSLLQNSSKDVLEEANRISKLSRLPIRMGQENEFPNIKNIEIICTPEKKSIFFDEKVKVNFLQSIKYENDFINLRKKTKCIIEYGNNKLDLFPTITEKHCVRFNHRFNDIGIYKFYIVNEQSVVSEEYYFEVI